MKIISLNCGFYEMNMKVIFGAVVKMWPVRDSKIF